VSLPESLRIRQLYAKISRMELIKQPFEC